MSGTSLWLTRYGAEGASSRYRAIQFATALHDAGWNTQYEPLAPWRGTRSQTAGGVARRLGRLASLASRPTADVVVVQKEPVMPPRLWPLVAPGVGRHRSPLVWDVDDAVWIGSDGAATMTRAMATTADVVVAGNPLIAGWMNDAGARRVQVVPTCYRPVGARSSIDRGDTERRVVWIGSPATAPLLHDHEPLLETLARQPGVQLDFVGGTPPPTIAGRPNVRVRGWSTEIEHDALSQADFGLALQPRTRYADHKCGFKIVQYLAYGVIPIATDNPVHRWILDDIGLLLGGDTDPSDVTDLVLAGAGRRHRAAATGRWAERFTPDVAAAAWIALLDELTAEGS